MAITESTTRITIGPDLGRMLDVARAAGLPVLLIGKHGIGKSEYLAHYARSRGLSFHPMDLSLLEATDLTGLPYRDGELTRFAPPARLPNSRAEAPSLFVLEELNRCDRSVRQPCLQLLTARELNDYTLPGQCFVVACVNPPDAGYDVDQLDDALQSRFLEIWVTADREAWCAWARENDVHPGVVGFVERNTQAFEGVPPRTWTHAARLLRQAELQGWEAHELQALLRTVLPDMPRRALLQWLRNPHTPALPDPLAVLAEPRAHADWVKENVREKRLDVLRELCDQLSEALETEAGQAALKNARALRALLSPVPADLRETVESSLEALAP